MRALLVVGAVLIAGCVGVLEDPGPDGASGPETGSGRPRMETCRGLWDPAVPDPRDFAVEMLNVTITASGSFRVGVPVPAASPETSFESWARNATVVPSDKASVATVTTAQGEVLVIEGEGDVVLCSQAIHGRSPKGNRCCAEAYLDAAWTTEPSNTRPSAIDVWVADGSVDLDIEYYAESRWCGRDASFDGDGVTGGWRGIQGQDGAWCE